METTKSHDGKRPVQGVVIPESPSYLTVDAAIENADRWIEGHTFDCSSRGWRINNAVLASEVKRLRGIMQNDILSAIDDCIDLGMDTRSAREVVKATVAKALKG